MRRQLLPLEPLVRAYAASGRRADAPPDDAWLNDAFLDTASSTDFAAALERFYRQVVSPPLHVGTAIRRAGLVRHGVAHLLRCGDPWPIKLGRCLAADGPYRVPGLGPSFWSAVAQRLAPESPTWTPATFAGLRRLAEVRDDPAATYARFLAITKRVRAVAPDLTGRDVDDFFALVGRMTGRDLLAADTPDPLPVVIARERQRLPLRQRLKDHGKRHADARALLLDGLKANDRSRVFAAILMLTGPRPTPDWEVHGPALLPRIERLMLDDEPADELPAFDAQAQLAGVGRWFAAAVLHLRDPKHWPLWDDAAIAGLRQLDDAADDYPLIAEALDGVCRHYRLHPLEAPAVLAALADDAPPVHRVAFPGFSPESFRFLAELAMNNRTDWMRREVARYRFAVREPLAELCRALADRYVGPVLSELGFDLETAAKTGGALTSICRNDYGRGVPYESMLWIAFCRRGRPKRGESQLFVRLAADGLSFGFRLGRLPRPAVAAFRLRVRDEAIAPAAGVVYGQRDDLTDGVALTDVDALHAWADGPSPVVGVRLAADDPLAARDDLVGEVQLAFDRVVPLFACAVADDARALLDRRATGTTSDAERAAAFGRATFLPPSWLRRALDLLALKSQLILQGVPGTGKTHVARRLAEYLTRGRHDAVRLVQMHPTYSYEEFVEGIKARTVEANGRHDVTYPIEDGVLAAFAAEAASRPAEPFVLIVDEINRGNLPRVFGELLYLLEYRDHVVTLPYSRREFRLPPNLVLIGTMNAADRSVAKVDHALRRRFSFLEMPPDARVLADWLTQYPPRAGDEFAATTVRLFETLNERLRLDLGADRQVGHSYFMARDLDPATLRAVWDHQVSPLLADYFAAQPTRLAAYAFDDLLAGKAPRPARAKSVF